MNHRIIVSADSDGARVDKNIYGHFAEHLGRCIYEGIWVGEESPIPNVRGIRSDVVEALKRIKAPIVRWPGGCFADEYHWKDGVGAPADRKQIVNTHWGGVVESNRFGTHEFMDFCRQTGAEPYVCGNVGSGTVQEMQEWVEYMNSNTSSPMADWRRDNAGEHPFGLKYFGVGNENWGCGGNMRPEYYADLYRRYASFVRDYGGTQLFKVACGPRGADYRWTEVLMREAADSMDGLALHYYSRMFSTGSNRNERRGSATEFGEDEWALILRRAHDTEHLVHRHAAVMDRYDPEKRVALIVDEWGTWFEEEPGTERDFLYQQNTMRDALVASISLNIFNNHADRVRMANIAQTVNVLQAMVLTRGSAMVLTPTYHVFDLYSDHQNATLVPTDVQTDQYKYDEYAMKRITASASRADDGSMLITANNADPNSSATVECVVRGSTPSVARARVLSASLMNEYNTFEDPERIVSAELKDYRIEGDSVVITMPPMSVVALKLA